MLPFLRGVWVCIELSVIFLLTISRQVDVKWTVNLMGFGFILKEAFQANSQQKALQAKTQMTITSLLVMCQVSLFW